MADKTDNGDPIRIGDPAPDFSVPAVHGEGDIALAEGLICAAVERVLERCGTELESLERERAPLEAVTRPFPGAFSHVGDRKFYLWSVDRVASPDPSAAPGKVVGADPLLIACGEEAVQVRSGQAEDGVVTAGSHLARELQLVVGTQFGGKASTIHGMRRKKRVLILGINGFIGNHLTERLLESGRYEVGTTTGYVNRGLGMEGGAAPRVRFCARPELTILDVTPAR